MGAAAYNRGTRAISAQIDRERPSSGLQLLRDLTAYSGTHARCVPFADTVIRFGPTPGLVTLMNRQAGGWRQRGYEYRSLWTLARAWRLVFLRLDADEHGRYVAVAPQPIPRVQP